MKQELKEALELIVEAGLQNLASQNHVNTKELIQSIEKRIYELSEGLSGEILGAQYGLAQETGIRKENIPFTEHSGNKKSQYIELIFWT